MIEICKHTNSLPNIPSCRKLLAHMDYIETLVKDEQSLPSHLGDTTESVAARIPDEYFLQNRSPSITHCDMPKGNPLVVL